MGLLPHVRIGLFALFIAVPLSVHASLIKSQEKAPAPASTPNPAKPDAEQKEADEAKSNVILLAHGLTNKLLTFTDTRTKATAIARIAGQLWKVDEAFARALFDKALQVTKPANSNDARTLTGARRTIISLIAKRDKDWAQRLIDQATETESGNDLKARSSLEIATALALLEDDDAQSATIFARQSMADQLQPPAQLDFLLRLRKTNEPGANQLFLQGLNYFARAPKPDVRGLHTFGLYLFTSPSLLTSDSFAITLVDRLLVPNITVQRPGVPDTLVRSYLSTAVTVLWSAVDDSEQQPYSYALGFLLLPKARSVAPDLAARIEGAMSAVSSRVPPNLTTDAAYKYINAQPLTAEESLARAEQKTDQDSKDVAYFDIAASAWRKGDFKLARTANAKISNLDVSRKLTLLIDFAEATNLIRLEPIEANVAQRVAERLDAGIEKAMLFLSIAKARETTRENALSEEAVDLALKSVASMSDARRPFLILVAAGQLTSLRSSAAPVVWRNAIKDFNRFEATEFSKIDWGSTVQLGELSLNFPLAINGTDLAFGSAFRRTLASDPDAALTYADELKNESFRATGYVETVTALLEKPPKNRTSNPSSAPVKSPAVFKP